MNEEVPGNQEPECQGTNKQEGVERAWHAMLGEGSKVFFHDRAPETVTTEEEAPKLWIPLDLLHRLQEHATCGQRCEVEYNRDQLAMAHAAIDRARGELSMISFLLGQEYHTLLLSPEWQAYARRRNERRIAKEAQNGRA